MSTLCSVNNIVAINAGFCNYVLNTDTGVYELLDLNVLQKKTDPTNLNQNHENNTSDIGTQILPGMDIHGGDSRAVIMRYCCALSSCGTFYATITSNKNLVLLKTNPWVFVSERKLERAASKIIFTPSNGDIIVADKTGDVYSYSVTEPTKNGQLLLGHVSVVLDVLVTSDEKYIITSDRDDKIRISHYPTAYNVLGYCLGHTEFVIRIVLLKMTLLSASGDGFLRFWSYEEIKLGTPSLVLAYPVSQDIVQDCGTRKEMDSVDEDSRYPITHVSSGYDVGHELLFCVSVNGISNIFVYKFDPLVLDVKCIQKIDLHSEPFTFCLSSHLDLWVLLPSETDPSVPMLKLYSYSNDFFTDALLNTNTENSIAGLNNLFLMNRCHFFQNILSGLYKMPKDKCVKRIKKE